MHALFLSLVCVKRLSAIISWPCQCHSMGALTVRRPRETIPVNFRVVTNFDIAIDAATATFGGRVDGSKMGLGGGVVG